MSSKWMSLKSTDYPPLMLINGVAAFSEYMSMNVKFSKLIDVWLD